MVDCSNRLGRDGLHHRAVYRSRGPLMSRHRVTATYRNLDLSGTMVSGELTGDPDVPGGVHRYPLYIRELYVRVGKEDITNMLSDDAFEECCEALLREARH